MTQTTAIDEREYNRQIAQLMGELSYDPYGFVMTAFPWGLPGPLENKTGPRRWQAAMLKRIGEKLQSDDQEGATLAIQEATSSGHGIGKSAMVAFLSLWAICTRPNTRGIITANTETQLKNKTWPELAKWYNLLICKHWFEFTATAIFSKHHGYDKTWRIDMQNWSENNPEAFAGLHNQGNRILIIFDEASAIPPIIWETASGALTDEDTEIIWCCFGNPTRNDGAFRECFDKQSHRWTTQQIDSREVEETNKAQLDALVADYGEDSDFIRIRVRGVFPRASADQLIPLDVVRAAQKRDYGDREVMAEGLVMGIDVARMGDDKSTYIFRRGSKSYGLKKFTKKDTVEFAMIVGAAIDQERPDIVYIDMGNTGAGVYDILVRQMKYKQIVGVDFGGTPLRPDLYVNKRTEMWATLAKWLEHGAIDNDLDLEQDLITPLYSYRGDSAKMELEKKKDIKARGYDSPDCGDALALTHAGPVPGGKSHGSRNTNMRPKVRDDFEKLFNENF